MKYLKKYEEITNRLFNISNKGHRELIKFIEKCVDTFAVPILQNNGVLNPSIYINKPLKDGTKVIKIEKEYSTWVFFQTEKLGTKSSKNLASVFEDRLREICYLLLDKYQDYEFQKDYLEKNPNDYKELELVGINPKIQEEFDYLFNADDMGLL